MAGEAIASLRLKGGLGHWPGNGGTSHQGQLPHKTVMTPKVFVIKGIEIF